MTHDPITDCRCRYCRPALRGIASGCIWPLGREHACDLAQVRTLERELTAMEDPHPCA